MKSDGDRHMEPCRFESKIDKLGEDVAVLVEWKKTTKDYSGDIEVLMEFKKSTQDLFNQIRGFLIANIGAILIGGALLAWVILKK